MCFVFFSCDCIVWVEHLHFDNLDPLSNPSYSDKGSNLKCLICEVPESAEALFTRDHVSLSRYSVLKAGGNSQWMVTNRDLKQNFKCQN